MKKQTFFLTLVVFAALLAVVMNGAAAAVNLTVQNNTIGRTPEFFGTVEGGHWNVADLADCGMNSVRLYCDMARIEPTDDDGVYGSPSIAELKANLNLIPWSLWDQRLNDPNLWGTGVSLAQILADCAANGIQPLLCMRTKDINAQPSWAPSPPFDDTNPAAKNELWEFCFALAYWCNVRHNYGFFEWQAFNEPDRSSQGWTGTDTQYAEFVKVMYDAVSYANGMAGLPTWMHVGNSPGWGPLDAALQNADPQSQVADYHYYRHAQVSQGQNAYGRVKMYNPDGVFEPLWNSEWGTYQTTYDGSMGMTVADDLFEFATFDQTVGGHCRGTSIFVMWDWGGYDGLVNADGTKNASYWAHRLMNRALQGGKERLRVDGAGRVLVLATRDTTNVYVVVLDNANTINVNLTPLGIGTTTARLYYYKDGAYNDVQAGTPAVTGGQASFAGLQGGVALLVVPK